LHLRIEDLLFDDRSRDKLASHRVPIRAVRQVFFERPKYRKNRRRRAASHQMIGPDWGGVMWTMCIKETNYQPGLWRVVNGWPAGDEEKGWYERN
jgi:hypothetical protein